MKKKYMTGMALTALLTVGILAGCSKEETKGKIEDGKVTETSTSLSDGGELTEQNIDLKDDGSFKEIVTGKNDPKVKFEVTYKTDYKDDAWDGVQLEIDKVKVVEVDRYTDKEGKDFKGLVSMHYTIENNGKEDIHVKPYEATILLKDGTEIKAENFGDEWDDVFSKDKKKDGFIYFRFDKTDEIDSIKEMHLKFDGRYKDSDVDKVDHEYNIELPLTPAS